MKHEKVSFLCSNVGGIVTILKDWKVMFCIQEVKVLDDFKVVLSVLHLRNERVDCRERRNSEDFEAIVLEVKEHL